MKLIKVGAAALNQTPLDWNGNERRIREAIRLAREDGVSLLCLPELCITGYGCEDAFLSPDVQHRALAMLREVATQSAGMMVALGLPVLYRKALFDAVAVVVDTRIAGFVAKRRLAGDGLHYEPRWFKPWPGGLHGRLEIAGQSYPIGDLIFVCDGVKVGFEICEEAWVARRPGSKLAARGVDVLLNPSASHFAFNKVAIRRRFVLEGSRAFGVSYVYSNLLGNEAGRAIYDGGALIASGGRLRAEGPRFSYAELELTSAVVDIDADRMLQSRIGSFLPDLDAAPEGEVAVDLSFPDIDYAESSPRAASVKGEEGEKLEDFTRAVALALFDYLRKSRAQGFVVSLSGGADSAAVSCLVAEMVRQASSELGMDGLRQRLPHIGALADCTAPEEATRRLLLCVYQSTRNSSETTREAARGVASGIGAEFMELDVDELVQGYEGMISAAIGRPLSWEGDDVARQNIQARVRSPGVWMLANLRGALLLSTSNRSEAAVGYATMDGDTSGGLSPIAGIDKAFLRRWMRWMEHEGPDGSQPIPELAAVNVQPPTAELRPPQAGQTDEQDLMPYELLDAIERAAIRDKKAPLGVYRTMRVRYPDIERRQLASWVERFFVLWCRNQWKRERYAPSFHVDDENLDPKTWCRFPILSGGFERELETLRRHLEG